MRTLVTVWPKSVRLRIIFIEWAFQEAFSYINLIYCPGIGYGNMVWRYSDETAVLVMLLLKPF
jgi:hypothetical protein